MADEILGRNGQYRLIERWTMQQGQPKRQYWLQIFSGTSTAGHEYWRDIRGPYWQRSAAMRRLDDPRH